MFGRAPIPAPSPVPSFGATPLTTWSASDGIGACPTSSVYFRAQGGAGALVNWDATKYRLALSKKGGLTSGACASASWVSWNADVTVDGADGSWGGAGSGYEQSVVDVTAYEASPGAQHYWMAAQVQIVRRSDSAVIDTASVSCLGINYDYCV